jgi:ribosome-associated translation inhibitor RaiA
MQPQPTPPQTPEIRLSMPGYSEGARHAVLERLEFLARRLPGACSLRASLGKDVDGHHVELLASAPGKRLSASARGDSLARVLERCLMRIEGAYVRRRARRLSRRREGRSS